ncbi:unnamed protein product [Schistosoma margrebowiei]|uniref:Reverse transcriptase domain-containing protein n=1 Tax=Schistosoma margrebowiei TaxID=48269 RepID=A0A3P7ZPB1_9TREM|nr:unnamed protein product [Schistosoma margrebowiei]
MKLKKNWTTGQTAIQRFNTASTSEGKDGIQWTAQNQLDDLNFADNLALLSHTHEQMQIKTASVVAVSASVGINIHKEKTKVLKFKAENSNPITLDGETLEDVESFTYLGSIIDEQGESDADVKARIGKARVAFLQLKNIWNSKQLSTNIKLSKQNTSDPLARHYEQQPNMGENKPELRDERNQEEALEVDRTHIEESIQLRHKASPFMESSMPKEERKTREHITSRNGDRHEENEQELNRTRTEGPRQCVLENVGWSPMLH